MQTEPNISKYRVAKWGCRAFILLGPAAVLVLLEYLSFRDGSFNLLAVLLLALVYGGYKGSSLMEAWEWEAVGRPAGLLPIDGEPRRDELSKKQKSTSTPILTGRVRGRLVRALSVRESQGTGQGSRTATIIETDLRDPSDAGVIIEPAGDGFLLETIGSAPGEIGIYEDGIYEDGPNVPGPRFAAVADPPELAQRLLSGRPRDAISAIQPFHRLLVGNAERTLHAALPDWEDKSPDIPLLGSAVDQGMKRLIQGSRVRGDAQTVTHYLAGETIRDPEVLEQHAKSVVAVAEAFEKATSLEAGDSGERKEQT